MSDYPFSIRPPFAASPSARIAIGRNDVQPMLAQPMMIELERDRSGELTDFVAKAMSLLANLVPRIPKLTRGDFSEAKASASRSKRDRKRSGGGV